MNDPSVLLPDDLKSKIEVYALPRPLTNASLKKIKTRRRVNDPRPVLQYLAKKMRKVNVEEDKREKIRHIKELMIFLDAYFEYTQTTPVVSDLIKINFKCVVKSACVRLMHELSPLLHDHNTLIKLMKKHAASP